MDATATPRTVVREPVAGACPACGEDALARYPVLGSGGWFEVVKCQRCLTSVARRPWHRLGTVDRDHADRALGS